jgi:alpha-tubulin suppressor-like RCC1 family protein
MSSLLSFIALFTLWQVTIGYSAVAPQISSGYDHNLVIKSDGSLWAWGVNSQGQLGDGSTVNSSTPILIDSTSTWIAVAGGQSHSLGLKSDGSLWAWGYNYNGQLGDDCSTRFGMSPVLIDSTGTWTAVTTRRYHSLGLKSDGSLWAWGKNNYGQIGDGSAWSGTPLQITKLIINKFPIAILLLLL